MQTAILVAAATVLAGCGKESGYLLVLDDWWAVDYAKSTCERAKDNLNQERDSINLFGCESVTACPELRATDFACTTGLAFIDGPYALVRDFDDRLETELAVNSQCSGVRVATYGGPGADNKAYQAMVEKHGGLRPIFSDCRLFARRSKTSVDPSTKGTRPLRDRRW